MKNEVKNRVRTTKTKRYLSNMQKGDGINNSYQKSESIQNWQSLGSNN
jgi:hypothetical protein